jgi:DNA primase
VQKLTESQRSFLKEAMIRYHSALEGSHAAEYLEGRALTASRVDKFRLGFVGDPLPGHEMFKGFLAIPYLRKSQNEDWSVVSIRFRCVYDHDHKGHGKYMTVAGDRPRLYNTLALLRESPTVAVCEGELDAITAQLCGIPAVGVPGAQAWQSHFREPFLGYREVLVLCDGDDAGMAFGHTVAATLPNAKIIPMPPGEDVNSLVATKGMDALLERIK